MRQERPSCLFIALLVLLLSIGLGALIVLSVSGPRPPALVPTVAPAITVLVAGTAAGTPALPSPSATAPIEAILATPSRTPVPPLVLVDTPEPTGTPRATDTPAPATPERTPVQKGEVLRG